MDQQRCAFCGQTFSETDWTISLSTGARVHMQCAEVDARRARRGRAFRAWRDLATALLILLAILTTRITWITWPWEGLMLYAAGGASAALYGRLHAPYWRGVADRLRRWWRNPPRMGG